MIMHEDPVQTHLASVVNLGGVRGVLTAPQQARLIEDAYSELNTRALNLGKVIVSCAQTITVVQDEMVLSLVVQVIDRSEIERRQLVRQFSPTHPIGRG